MAVFVLDASAALPWCFQDEVTPWSDSILQRLEGIDAAVVPSLWPIEMANAFLSALRRKRIQASEIQGFWLDLARLTISAEAALSPAEAQTVTDLAIQNSLTIYDALYLDLALRRKLPIATLDNALRQAALANGITLL